MKPAVVTFATDDWYADRAVQLRVSCGRHGYECIIARLPDLGRWVLNCGQKARFCLGMHVALDRPIIWLDADSTVRRPMTLFDDPPFDFAVYMQGGGSMRKQSGRDDVIPLPDNWPEKAPLRAWMNSGTVYFGPRARPLLYEWVKEQAARERWYDQWTLQYAWATVADRIKTHWLLPEYCTCAVNHKMVRDPVVVHEFASVIRKVDRT